MEQQPTTTPVQATGPVTMVMKYAGFWKRVAAIIIDGVILNVVLTIISSLLFFPGSLYFVHGHGMYYVHHDPLSFALYWFYFALLESSMWQATLGKMLVGIKVTDINGNRITFLRATGRYFAKIISFLIICIGFIMAGFTEKKQALHDMIAKTLVVNSK